MKKVIVYWVNGTKQTWALPDANVGDAIAALTRTGFTNVKEVRIVDVVVDVLPSQEELEALGAKDAARV